MFEPVNEIERLLIAAATEVNARNAFTTVIMEADLYISPAGEPPADGGRGQIVVSYLEFGEEAAAVFTSPQRLHEIVGGGANIEAVKGRALFQLLGSQPVHLNPNLVPSVIWSAADVQEMLTGSRPIIAKAGDQVLLGHPKERPGALIAALSTGLGAAKMVSGAWLSLAHRSGEAEQSWMLGVEHSGSWGAVNAVIGHTINGVDLSGRTLEATSIKNNSLGKQLRAGIPILAPKKRGLFGFLKG